MRAVFEKYSHGKMSEDEEIPPGSYSVEQILGEKNDPQSSNAARKPHGAKLRNAPKKEETP